MLRRAACLLSVSLFLTVGCDNAADLGQNDTLPPVGSGGIGSGGTDPAGGAGGTGGTAGTSGNAGTSGEAGNAGGAGSGGSAGSAGSGGSAGSAGSGGSAGASASAGAAGASGSAGGAGSGGSAGSGGTCNTGAPVHGGMATTNTPCDIAASTACAGEAQPIVVVCDPDTCLWSYDSMCSGGQLCDRTDTQCKAPVPACIGQAPGTVVCDGSERHVCGPDLVSSEVEYCASAQLCALGTGPSCALCLDGEYRCVGAELQRCADDHQSFEFQQDCATAALCNATAGACTSQVCVPGQHRCDGDRLEQCDPGGSQFLLVQTCSSGLCDAQGEQCDVCVPSVVECAGNTSVRTCSSDGQSWNVESCQSGTPWCTGAGVCVQCRNSVDCPASTNPCEVALCESNQCGVEVTTGATCGGFMHCDAGGACICNDDHDDCNLLAGDGCEANLLSDSANCGVCGRDCLGGACQNGQCQPVLLSPQRMLSLEVDDTYLYGADTTVNFNVLRLSKNGGGIPTTLMSGESGIDDVEIDYSTVYVAESGSPIGRIVSVPKAGGSIKVYSTYQNNARRIAVSGNYVYFSTLECDGSGSSCETTVKASPKWAPGTTPNLIASVPWESGVLSDILIVETGTFDGDLFWSVDGNGQGAGWITKRDGSSYAITTFVASERPTAMVSDGNKLYWIDITGYFYSKPLSGGARTTLAALDYDQASPANDEVQQDDTHLYWGGNYYGVYGNNSYLYRLPKTGGPVETLRAGAGGIGAVAVDDEALYWADDGGVHRIAK